MERPWRYPVLITNKRGGVYVERDDARFRLGTRSDLRRYPSLYIDKHIIDLTMHHWRTTGARFVGYRPPFAGWRLPWLNRVGDVEYDVELIGKISADGVRRLVHDAVDANPDLWDPEVEGLEMKQSVASSTTFEDFLRAIG